MEDHIHRIAILSDTHSLLRPEVREVLGTCEAALHAGDIASRELYEEVRAVVPSYFVRGNADGAWARELPEELAVTLYGLRFYMVHNKKHIPEDLDGVDVVLYGHSHKYVEVRKDGRLYLNPGSCGPRRFHLPVTMAVMTADEKEHSYVVEKIDLSPVLGAASPKISAKDMDRLIRAVIKDMDAGKQVPVIAKRNRIEESYVSQILQIYTTHPGIDVDGIMNRLDILGK